MHSVTITMPDELYRRLVSKLTGDGTALETKVRSLLEEYVDGAAESLGDLTGQIEIAQQIMREYEDALRELGR